jgi:hypothetical protein
LLLHGLQDCFGDQWFYAREVMVILDCSSAADGGDYIKEALEVLCPARSQLNARTVGNLLKFRVDTHCDGLVLRMADGEHKTNKYRVERG